MEARGFWSPFVLISRFNAHFKILLNTERGKFTLFVRQVKRAINLQMMHYENAIIACFQSKISIHLHGSFCWPWYSSVFHSCPGSLSYLITSSWSLPFYLPISLFLSIQPTLLPYLSNFSLTVLLCHNSHPFLSFSSFFQYFSFSRLSSYFLLLHSLP